LHDVQIMELLFALNVIAGHIVSTRIHCLSFEMTLNSKLVVQCECATTLSYNIVTATVQNLEALIRKGSKHGFLSLKIVTISHV